jgi:hypothetical protein
MNKPRVTGNPFDLTKASDFSDEQINQYWVDLAGEARLKDLLKPTLHMPMLLLGGKGSGKTHLMRYFSSPVQQLRFQGDLLKAVQEEGHVGIYVRADGLNALRFDGKGQDVDQWATVFSYYFELWLATHLIKNIQDCLRESPGALDEKELVYAAKNLFLKPQPENITDLKSFIDHLAQLRKDIDHVVSNCAITKSLLGIDIALAPGELVFGLPSLINQYTNVFKDVIFVYMIDEIENFTATQQRFLNTLIRYRRGSVSIKIGARLYGIRTKETLTVGEKNKEGAEYEQVELDSWLREHDGYKALARELIIKRLQQALLAPPGNLKEYKLDDWFDVLNKENNYRIPALELVRKYDERKEERPYFKELRDIVSLSLGTNKSSATQLADEIIKSIEMPNDPLLEKVNLYLLYRDWCQGPELITIANRIGKSSQQYLLNGKKGSKVHFEKLDHFKSDFLAQLYHDCGKHRVVYAGIDTLIDLSQGIPRNLLGLLKHIYRRSFFAGENPFYEGGKISINSQIEGIRDAAAWFWDDVQPDSHGYELRNSIEVLAELFRGIRFSLKPAECKCSTFTIDTKIGTSKAREALKHAENWSYLIRIRDGAINSNDGAVIDEKYQLSPMLAPRWEISEHRRGTIQLQEDLLNAIFDPLHSDKLKNLLEKRLKGMREPYSKTNSLQTELF